MAMRIVCRVFSAYFLGLGIVSYAISAALLIAQLQGLDIKLAFFGLCAGLLGWISMMESRGAWRLGRCDPAYD